MQTQDTQTTLDRLRLAWLDSQMANLEARVAELKLIDARQRLLRRVQS
jgi:hypothetical protein